MRVVVLALLLGITLYAQNDPPTLSFYIDNSEGAPTQSLPLAYAFPDTSVGQTASIMVSVVNTSASTVVVSTVYVGSAPGSSTANNNFGVSNLDVNAPLAPGALERFYVNFTPTVTGPASGFLQASIAGNNTPIAASSLSGAGLPPPVTLTCSDSILTQLCSGTTPIPANSALTFGPTTGVALGDTHTITFTLTNTTSAAVPTPTPVLASEVYASPSFTSPDIAALPTSIAPNSPVTFSIVFAPQASAPGPSTAQTATLTVGSAQFNLQGYEQASTLNDPPKVSCVYTVAADQGCASPASNTYSFGPDSRTLTGHFTIENHNDTTQTSNTITITAGPSVSNPAFTIQNTALQPLVTGTACATTLGQVVIPAGCELAFDVTFTGSTAVTGSTLSFSYSEPFLPDGKFTYTLNAQPTPVTGGSQSGLPGLTLMCGATPCSTQTFTSDQQVTASLQVPSTSATLEWVSTAITFTPSITGIPSGVTTADPAIKLLGPNPGSTGQLSFTPDSATGTASTAQFTFQTGTTEGTISFTMTDVTDASYTVTIPILPSKVQVTSSTAVRSSPNLILTIVGYDNTHTANQLSFTFYDINGTNLTPNPITVDATTQFQQYFFTPVAQSDGSLLLPGGAFSLQLTFPVTGDVTQIGSVKANITNSAGQASVTQTFQ